MILLKKLARLLARFWGQQALNTGNIKILSLQLTIDIEDVKIRILYSRLLLDQKIPGSRPDGATR